MSYINNVSLEYEEGYLVFFDNVRVDQYVSNYNITMGLNEEIAMGTLNMTYVPEFTKIRSNDSSVDKLLSSKISQMIRDGLEAYTDVRIFVKNPFNSKYVQIFEGYVSNKSRSMSGDNKTISISIMGVMEWMNRAVCPIASDLEGTIANSDILRFAAQGIESSKITVVTSENEVSFKGMDVAKMYGRLLDLTYNTNKLFTEDNSVSKWHDAFNRVSVMGDISESLRKAEILDFNITASLSAVNTVYTSLSEILQTIMFEFYQDRDGTIKIKPPYWNEDVLLNHVIDPTLIISFADDLQYSNMYTRVCVTGSVDEEVQDDDGDDFTAALLTPVGVATIDGINISSSDTGQTSSLLSLGNTERKYGALIYDCQQQYIKTSVASATQTLVSDMIKKYAKFMLGYLNSATDVAVLTTKCMPWIRPGFNVWVAPVGVDKIYYVSSINHYGSPDGNFSSFNLTMGRPREAFVSGKDEAGNELFGKRNPGSNENPFVESMYIKASDFGAVCNYDDVLNQCKTIYMVNGDEKGKTLSHYRTSAFYRYLYAGDSMPEEEVSKKLDASFTIKLSTASAGEVESEIFRFLTEDMGLSIAAACGILANIAAESGFNLSSEGDSGTSYGICQWHDTRKQSLIDYCNSNNFDYTSLSGQLEYLRYELSGSESGTLNEIKNCENTAEGAYLAARIFCINFERPSDKYTKATQRAKEAKETYWPKYSA